MAMFRGSGVNVTNNPEDVSTSLRSYLHRAIGIGAHECAKDHRGDLQAPALSLTIRLSQASCQETGRDSIGMGTRPRPELFRRGMNPAALHRAEK
jgi:hypothetical protein